MMVINKAETHDGISLILFFFLRKQYIYASQTICLRGVNVFFTTRKRAICGFKARGMARLLPPQAIWCDWKS